MNIQGIVYPLGKNRPWGSGSPWVRSLRHRLRRAAARCPRAEGHAPPVVLGGFRTTSQAPFRARFLKSDDSRVTNVLPGPCL